MCCEQSKVSLVPWSLVPWSLPPGVTGQAGTWDRGTGAACGGRAGGSSASLLTLRLCSHVMASAIQNLHLTGSQSRQTWGWLDEQKALPPFPRSGRGRVLCEGQSPRPWPRGSGGGGGGLAQVGPRRCRGAGGLCAPPGHLMCLQGPCPSVHRAPQAGASAPRDETSSSPREEVLLEHHLTGTPRAGGAPCLASTTQRGAGGERVWALPPSV